MADAGIIILFILSMIHLLGIFLYPVLFIIVIRSKKIKKKFKFILLPIIVLAFLHAGYIALHFDDDKICWDKGGEWVNNKCKFKND